MKPERQINNSTWMHNDIVGRLSFPLLYASKACQAIQKSNGIWTLFLQLNA